MKNWILSKSLIYLFLILILVVGQSCSGHSSRKRYIEFTKIVEAKTPGAPQVANNPRVSMTQLDEIEAFDLKTAIELALHSNPSLNAMSEKVKEAASKYPLVTALADPTIGVGLYPSTIGSGGSDFAYKINFNQRIPYPGKLNLKGDYALAEAKAVFKDFRSARLELIRLVKTAYLELYFAYSAVKIIEEERRLLTEFKAIASARYAAGKGNLQNVIHADLDLARVEHKQIVINRKLKIATARLNVFMGKVAGLPLPSPSGLPPLVPLSDKERLIEKAQQSNPEIASAKSRIEAAQVSLKLAKSKSYPDFMVTGSYNNAWMNEELHPFIGIGVNIPIWSGRLEAENQIATSKINRAKWKLKAAMDKVRFDVEQAWQRINELRHAEALFHETLLPESRLNLKAARTGYSEGKNDFLTLITAQRALVETKLKYKRILVDMRIWDSNLIRTIGEKL